jgi:small subunit ribosomal protein S7
MPRKGAVSLRRVVPDIVFQSQNVTRLVNKVMTRGKKSLAERIVYSAIDKLNEGGDAVDPLELFTRAVENAKPRVEVKARRVGGATYQVPLEVPADRQFALALRWLVDFADARKGIPMKEALAAEILEAYQGQGNAIRKRDEVHKMAQANKAFAHFRW